MRFTILIDGLQVCKTTGEILQFNFDGLKRNFKTNMKKDLKKKNQNIMKFIDFHHFQLKPLNLNYKLNFHASNYLFIYCVTQSFETNFQVLDY